GVPTQTEPSAFAQNDSRGVQPYLYNGKEFVETPSNEYNVYDYGFRGYYATIGRFTSMDPLCEQTPWQSPYTYANNNFVNNIDYMGLMGFRSSTRECVVTNIHGEVIGMANDGDDNIYICLDDTWEPSHGKGHLIWVCEMEHSYYWYKTRYDVATAGGGGGHFKVLSKGQIVTAIGRSLIADIALGVADNYLQDMARGLRGSQTMMVVADTRAAKTAYDIFESFLTKGYNNQAAYDAAKEALTYGIKFAIDKGAQKAVEGAIALAPKVAAAAEVIAPFVAGTLVVALATYSYYKAGEYFMNMVWDLQCTLNSPQFWGWCYGCPTDKKDW
ncbi:MAG: hypothetical protein J5621_02935, partial [Paludibacteraceae bacterium]|nr:hypothetical protein [Paludibacteraceae bacterium]